VVMGSFGWHAYGQSAGEQISRSIQAQLENQNRLYQEKAYQDAIQAKIQTAQLAAAQAAEYAKQAALYGNQAASLAATYAQQASGYAQKAASFAQQAAAERLVGREFLNQLDGLVASAQQVAANAKQAAEQSAIDSAISKLAKERDEAISKVKSKYDPRIRELNFKISDLKEKAVQLESQRNQSEQENAHLRAKQLFQPKDPWRLLDGKVYNAKDASWVHFTGQILEIKPNGILVRGDFGPPLEANFGKRDYFVDNFPVQTYAMADGESITAPMNFVAHFGEKSSVYQFTNSTTDLHIHTVRKLDYGHIVSSPPPDLAKKWNITLLAGDTNPQLTKQIDDNEKEQAAIRSELSQLNSDFNKEREPIMAEYAAKTEAVPILMAQQAETNAKAKEDAKKRAVADRVLKSNQDAAAKGDAFGLLRMGERYRDGDGVPKDLAKARDYLTKAAEAGSPTATAELEALSPGKN